MKSLFFGSFKGCLLALLPLLLFIACCFMVIFDLTQAIVHNRTYFIDFNEIEVYDAPIFTDYEPLLIENLERRNTEITALKDYFLSIVPADVNKVEIEISKNKVEKFCLEWNGGLKCSYNHDFKSDNITATIDSLGWDLKTFDVLKNKLKTANCISISSGKKEPVRIGHKNGKSGLFLYNFFEQEIPSSTFQVLSDSCTFKYFKEAIFFEYHGKGRGPDCKHLTNHKNTEKSLLEKWLHLIKSYKKDEASSWFNLNEEDYTPVKIK